MGAWAVISECNSPLAAPIGYAVSAILAGNAVVLAPPKECPFPVYMMYEIIAASGLPDGILNIIFDPKGKAGALAEDERIAGIVAAGRSDRFEELMFAGCGGMKFISDLKGMNPMVVFKPSSMQAAADIALRSAFRYSGQRMDSCSKAIIAADEQKKFVDCILASAEKMTVGDPAEKETSVGPVISKESMNAFLKIADDAKENLIFGGKRVSGGAMDAGFYVVPAVFLGLPPDHDLNTIDHSLPILSIQIVNDMDEAVEAVNGCEFGASSGILSRDGNIIKKFSNEAHSDIVYANRPGDAAGIAAKADVAEFLKK
jgi:acyl-CoA reductase-like NAD-dependent aldehyde dehydrogenase